MMTPSESGGSGGTKLTLSKRYSAAFTQRHAQAASATDSLLESPEHDPMPPSGVIPALNVIVRIVVGVRCATQTRIGGG
jgi:hypothetical protein